MRTSSRSILSRFFVCAAALGSVLLAPGALAAEVLVDRVAAVVDGAPILYSDIQTKVSVGPLVTVSEFPASEHAPAGEKALQDAINFELIMQKAKELEIDVREEEVEGEIRSFLEARGLNREGLMSHLSQSGMRYEDYKRDFKDQMILRQFQGRVIRPLVKLTDKDLETYYLKKSGATSDLIELKLRQILLSVGGGASDELVEAKKKLAEEVHQKLVDGMPFVDAVKIYSDDPKGRENGGLMNNMRARDLAGVIRSAVEPLEVGQFTAPVRTAMGFHIFHLEEKLFAGGSEFQGKKKQLEFELMNQELMNQTRRWLAEARQKAKIEVIAE